MPSKGKPIMDHDGDIAQTDREVVDYVQSASIGRIFNPPPIAESERHNQFERID
jgi:hypothetical protein